MIIPDVDFSRNLYPQFQPVGRAWEPDSLRRSAKEFSDNSSAAAAVDPALHIAMGVAGQFLLLWGLSIGSRNSHAKRALGAVYASHIRMTNDIIQYALFVMVVGGIAPNAEVATALLPRN